MPTAANTTELVDAITGASLSLFRKRGFAHTSVGDIALKAATTPELIAGIFPEKEDLLAEVIWRDIKESAQQFDNIRPTGACHDTILIDFCRFICIDRIKSGKTGRFWSLYHTDDTIRDTARQGLHRLFFLLVEDGAKHGWFKPVRPELASAVVVSMLVTALDRFQDFEEPLHMFTETLSMIADAIAAKQPPSIDRKV